MEATVMAQEIDFSMLALFARATITVKIVMIMLIGMSVWSWSIIISKHILFRNARGEATIFDRAFWSGEPLDELFEKIGADPQGQSALQSAASTISLGHQDTLASDEGLAHTETRVVPKTALPTSGM